MSMRSCSPRSGANPRESFLHLKMRGALRGPTDYCSQFCGQPADLTAIDGRVANPCKAKIGRLNSLLCRQMVTIQCGSAPRIAECSVEVVSCHDGHKDDDNDECREQQHRPQEHDQPGMSPRGIREYPGDGPWILAPERRSVEGSKGPCHDHPKGLAKAFDPFLWPPLSWELEER